MCSSDLDALANRSKTYGSPLIGLTDEEIYARCNAFYRWSEWDEYMEDWLELGRAIETALKEKNT